MKTRALFIVLIGLAFFAKAQATTKQVTNVSATPSTILTPSNQCQVIVIQNNGSGAVRLGIDGGITNKQKSTPDPTATTGYLLNAGQFLIITRPGTSTTPNIRAILATGTTTVLDIMTDDPYST